MVGGQKCDVVVGHCRGRESYLHNWAVVFLSASGDAAGRRGAEVRAVV